MDTHLEEIITYVESLASNEILTNTREIIPPKELDVYDPSSRLGIEYNGLYFHSSASPSFQRNAHIKKFQLCQAAQIKLFAFFEDEWINKRSLIEAMIRWRMGRFNGTRLNASDCEVVKLEKNRDFESFFNRNHIDGSAKASYAYGLVYQGKLIQCLSIRKNFNKETEIARLATDYDYCVRGGSSRLMKQIKDRPLISFSNNRLSTGDVYERLGFEVVPRPQSPSYWYTDGYCRIWRYRCKRINTPEILEKYPTEISQATNGVFSQIIFGDSRPLYRIEDYGHRKWMMVK